MKLSFLLATLAVGNGLNIVATVGSFLSIRKLRIKVEEIGLFLGKSVVITCWGQKFRIGCIPTGTSVKYDVEDFRSRTTVERVGAYLSGPLVLAMIALAILGPTQALHHFSSGFRQLPMGALHPVSIGQALIADGQKIYLSSVWMWMGILAAKGTAASFIPFASINAGQLVQELFRLYDERGLGSWIVTVSALLNIGMFTLWAFAMIRYAVG